MSINVHILPNTIQADFHVDISLDDDLVSHHVSNTDMRKHGTEVLSLAI